MKRLLEWIDSQAQLPDVLIGMMIAAAIYALWVAYDMTWRNKR